MTQTDDRRRHRPTRAAALVAAAALALGGCAAAGEGDGPVTLTYWMWDANQLPAYQECASAFEAANPDVRVNIEQYGWEDYWTQLTARMVAESAPDVFVDHTQQFGKYAGFGQILDLEDRVEESGIDLDQYQPGLVDLWRGADGGLYGMPKDWDTVGLYYNADLLAEAGIDPAEMWRLEWNPQDGGSFERLLARLTVDRNGVRGDEPGFDSERVAVYGMGYGEAGGGFGQAQWASFALSTGWTYADRNPWPTRLAYDDPAFIETIGWYRSLIEKGYMPPLAAATSGIGVIESMGSGAYATLVEGAWNARAMSELQGVDIRVAPTPVGPSGQRASVFNGVSDAVYAGTPHPDEAWRWVEYLAGRDCQDAVATHARVFPAIAESSTIAVAAFEELGVDAQAFAVHVEDGTGVQAPVTGSWARIQSVMAPAMDAVLALQRDPSSLAAANDRVNAVLADDS
ncbi:sugar ABC transporter substrate-binding protein [Cellulomonas sp. KH9]|uniref:ABC transporter substrate-binding protein n=1 Tax=Cellulomonas sp. KH9 TaxID=1855324 RepID=UPI0008E6469C|nr:sugar ABC transporter substrate-binding protein [Cellulomonas sp. KH9]SFJ65497.1 carbohydrate ABC transporter substrate-binding protein, CUT1 family [Cellulomonas sp. KH9]